MTIGSKECTTCHNSTFNSYDYWENIKRICNGAVKEAIMNREGTVFVRGDSGDPVDIICGTQEFLVGDLPPKPLNSASTVPISCNFGLYCFILTLEAL